MAVLSVLSVLAFDIAVCAVEVPKLLGGRQIKELVTFSVLLLLGTVLAVLKSLDIEIPNPSDFQAWLFSPVLGRHEVYAETALRSLWKSKNHNASALYDDGAGVARRVAVCRRVDRHRRCPAGCLAIGARGRGLRRAHRPMYYYLGSRYRI